MGTPDLVVDVRGVTKWFGETTALDGVDLAIEAGQVHGLVGPNGAGKTTLLAVLFGLVRPDEGVTRLFGRTRAEAGRGWLDGVGGFVETPRFYPYLSGRDNLVFLAGLDGGDAAELIDDVLELVGLAAAGRQKVRGYSLGMRQRLGLAAALIRRPRLLILDEPANGMDPAGVRDLRAAVRRLAHDGLAVLLSSHDMAQVSETCERVTVLHQGRVAFAGSLDEMRAAAPEPVWRLATSDDGTALSLAGHDLRLRVTEQDGALRVFAEPDWLDAYVIRLGRAGVAVRALAQNATQLESLFFRLTDVPDVPDAAGGPRSGPATVAPE